MYLNNQVLPSTTYESCCDNSQSRTPNWRSPFPIIQLNIDGRVERVMTDSNLNFPPLSGLALYVWAKHTTDWPRYTSYLHIYHIELCTLSLSTQSTNWLITLRLTRLYSTVDQRPPVISKKNTLRIKTCHFYGN